METNACTQLQQTSTPLESDTGMYQCKICFASFESDNGLSNHCLQSGHNNYTCPIQGYNESFLAFWALDDHLRRGKHVSYACKTPACQQSFTSLAHLLTHLSHPHVDDHSRSKGASRSLASSAMRAYHPPPPFRTPQPFGQRKVSATIVNSTHSRMYSWPKFDAIN
jgi:hypothetical protein